MKNLRCVCLGIGFWICLVVSGQESPRLETRVYSVSPDFGAFPDLWETSTGGAAADPFADPVSLRRVEMPETAQEYLVEGGVVFEDGASATYDGLAGKLSVKNTGEELEKVEVFLEIMRTQGESRIIVYVEWIEVDHPTFSDWLFDHRMNSEGTELRNQVQEWIKAGSAEVIDSATVAGRSEQRLKTESVDAFTYPTEYQPPKVPNKLVLKDGAESPIVPTTPTGFTTRNLGTALEVAPVVGPDRFTVDLNLVPQIDQLEGTEQWNMKMEDPRFQIHMPTFYSMKITTQVTTQHGRYAFLGTTRPLKPANADRKNAIVLQFVRADVSSTADWTRDK